MLLKYSFFFFFLTTHKSVDIGWKRIDTWSPFGQWLLYKEIQSTSSDFWCRRGLFRSYFTKPGNQWFHHVALCQRTGSHTIFIFFLLRKIKIQHIQYFGYVHTLTHTDKKLYKNKTKPKKVNTVCLALI